MKKLVKVLVVLLAFFSQLPFAAAQDVNSLYRYLKHEKLEIGKATIYNYLKYLEDIEDRKSVV